jgi:hypothetical protein
MKTTSLLVNNRNNLSKRKGYGELLPGEKKTMKERGLFKTVLRNLLRVTSGQDLPQPFPV